MAAKRGHVDFMLRAPIPASGSATAFIMLRRECCGLLAESDISHIIKRECIPVGCVPAAR